MDLADATLVVLAEEQAFRRIFTLDRDFHIYRLRNRRVLNILP
jgi:predicted nucleic acid-binding protein